MWAWTNVRRPVVIGPNLTHDCKLNKFCLLLFFLIKGFIVLIVLLVYLNFKT